MEMVSSMLFSLLMYIVIYTKQISNHTHLSVFVHDTSNLLQERMDATESNDLYSEHQIVE